MRSIYIFIAVFYCNLVCIAQVDRSIPPEPNEPVKLNVGKLIPVELDNGLRIYLSPVKDYPKFTLSVNIELPNYDKEIRLAEKNILNLGYSSKLSEKYPKGEIDSIVRYHGATLNANMYGGIVKGMKKDIDQLLEIYVDALLNPIISKKEIRKKYKTEVSRKQQKEKIKQKKIFSTESVVDSLLFGSPKNSVKTKDLKKPKYKGLTVNKVQQYKEDRIVSNNALIIIVGDFTEEACKELMVRYFGAWKPGKSFRRESPVVERKTTIKNRKIIVKDVPNAVQSEISFKWHLGDAYTYFKDAVKLEVLNEVFGKSQLSYLYKNLREEKALCYFIRSSVGTSADGGTGSVFTAVRNNQTAYAIENIILEMLRLRNRKVSASDLKIAKNSLIGEYTRSLSAITPVPYITFGMQKDVYNLPDDYLQSKVDKYYEVSVDDIMKMSQKYIDPFKCVITVKGKVSELKGTLEKFGEVLYFNEEGTKIE